MKIFLIIFFLLAAVYSYMLFFVHMPSAEVNTIVTANSVWKTVQDWRIKNHLSPYIEDAKMCTLASLRLPEIQISFDHINFINHKHYSQICPLNNCTLAENLSRGYADGKSVLDAWINSPEHLANLKSNYKYSCVKCANNYCVEEFGNY